MRTETTSSLGPNPRKELWERGEGNMGTAPGSFFGSWYCTSFFPKRRKSPSPFPVPFPLVFEKPRVSRGWRGQAGERKEVAADWRLGKPFGSFLLPRLVRCCGGCFCLGPSFPPPLPLFFNQSSLFWCCLWNNSSSFTGCSCT